MDLLLSRSGRYQQYWQVTLLLSLPFVSCVGVDVRQFSVVEERTGGRSRSSLEGVSECVVEIAPSVMYEAGWGAGQGALVGCVS
jgi:hypothetical protein